WFALGAPIIQSLCETWKRQTSPSRDWGACTDSPALSEAASKNRNKNKGKNFRPTVMVRHITPGTRPVNEMHNTYRRGAGREKKSLFAKIRSCKYLILLRPK